MSKELSKEEFVERLESRDNGEYSYLYQVSVLATPNDNYVKYAHDYIINNEIEQAESGKFKLKGIQQITRKNSYKYKHTQTAKRNSGRHEELLVIYMIKNKERDDVKAVFGDVIDYQIPLKNKRVDKIGKIDFMFVKNGELCLAEIKAFGSNESALKAIMEVQTYYQVVDKAKLLSDFGLKPDTKIKKVIVLFNNTKGAKQVKENEFVKDLLGKFDIEHIMLCDFNFAVAN